MTRREADLLAELARELATEHEVDGVLRRVVDAAVSQIDGAELAGITVLSKSSVSTPIATDDIVHEVDRQQYATNEGPCLTAAVEYEPAVRVDDLDAETRWPRFTPLVVALGVRAMLSFQLYTQQDSLGALNIYARRNNAFTDDSVHTGLLLAAHAAVAIARTRKEVNLRIALESRDIIGQAKGILMERFRIDAMQAFDLLIAASQRTHRKLNEVAETLTSTGELVID